MRIPHGDANKPNFIGEQSMTQEQYNERLNELEKEISKKFGFPESIADLIVGKADIDNHSYGYEEVRTAAHDLAYFVKDIINFYKESKK